MSTPSQELRTLSRLAMPVVLTQVTVMLMGFFDVFMVGHVGTEALGAVSLGRLWVFGTMLVGMGVVFGIDPIVTQAHGARDSRRMGTALQRGIVLGLLVSIPLAVSWLFAEKALLLLGQDAGLARMAGQYVTVQIPSIPCFLVYSALRQYLSGRAIMLPALWVAILANFVNVGANWVFIYGKLGAPEMGVAGAGLSSGLTRTFMMVALTLIVVRRRLYEGGWVPWSRESWSLRGLLEVARYGMPVGVQMGLEIWAFEITTLLAGRLGNVPLAAHTIVLNLASLSFMVPLGLSMAVVTRVGNLIGEGQPRRAQTAAWVSLALGAGVMLVSAVVFVSLRHVLPALYTKDLAVIATAATLLPVAAAFQLFDGTQVVGSGILRGMGRTRPAAAFNLIGYYALGLPIAWWLGLHRGLGVVGLWWGLTVALAAVALMLVYWVGKRGPAHAIAITATPYPEEQPA